MFKNKFKISIILTIIIIVLAIIASAGGLFIKDLYRDNPMVKGVWYGNDIVTLFLAIPVMIGVLLLFIKGSEKAQLIWMGMLWYMVYNYIFYLYGAAFNKFFLLYVMLFTLSTYALIFALIKTDVKGIGQKFNEGTPVRWISGFMLFFAFSLGIPWIAMSLSYVFTGEIPQTIVQTGHPTSVVFATDLSLLISTLVLNAILLWKRQPWGYILSIIVMIKGLFYPLVLLIGGIFSYMNTGTWDSLIPLYILLGIGCMLSLWLLMSNMKSSNKIVKLKN